MLASPRRLQLAISHQFPRMSILVTSLRQPAVLLAVLPSSWGKACSHEVGLPRAAARIAPLPLAGCNRRATWQGAAAARARGNLKPRILVKHAPHPAVFAWLHSAAAVERQAGQGEKERGHSTAAG